MVNVADDDVPGLTITAVGDTITEGEDAQFRVTSSLALAQPLAVSVQVEDSGTFLTATAPTTVTVPAGGADVSVVLALPTDDDTTDEPDGTVTVTLQADAAYTISGTAAAVVNVTDDDVPEISIVAVGDTITEGAEAQFRSDFQSCSDSTVDCVCGGGGQRDVPDCTSADYCDGACRECKCTRSVGLADGG